MNSISQSDPARKSKEESVLYGARAIARYLGVCDMTVHRLKERGLPVRRAENGKLNITVVALDAWLKGGAE